jgi:hypothetical protein
MYTQEWLAFPSSAPCSGSGQNRRPSERYQAVERSATIRVAPAIVANRRFRPNGFVFSSTDSKAKLLAARALVCMRNPGSTQTASFFQRRIRPPGIYTGAPQDAEQVAAGAPASHRESTHRPKWLRFFRYRFKSQSIGGTGFSLYAESWFYPNGFVFSTANQAPRGSIPALRKTPNKSPRVPRSATGASNRCGKVEKFVRGARCGFPCGPRGDRCQARPCISTARGFRFCAAGLTARAQLFGTGVKPPDIELPSAIKRRHQAPSSSAFIKRLHQAPSSS